MVHTRPADDAASPDAIVVGADGRVDDAVRGHHDGAREAGELHLLVLPAAAVVANQMFEFTQLRIAVSRQHFAMSIDVDAGAFRLLQQVIQILQIVAGDQDALPFGGFNVDLSRRRMAVFGRFTGVEDAHHFEVHLADFHRTFEQRIHIRRPGAQPCHDFMVLGIDSVVVLAEHVGVLHIGRRTLQTVQAQQAQTENIFADGGFIFIRGIVRRLTLQVAQIVADQLQVGDRAVDRGAGIDRQALRFQRLTQGNCLAGVADDARGIEVNVSQGGEEGAGGKAVDLMIDNAIFARFKRPGGQALQ